MAERPCELGNFKGVRHFEAEFQVEGSRFAPISMDCYKRKSVKVGAFRRGGSL